MVSSSPNADMVPYALSVAIGDHAYLADLQNYRRRTLPALREQFDTAQEPGEQSLNVEGLWRRSQADWSHGAGQKYYDDADSDRRRFWQSVGIDPWEPGEIRLLPKASSRRTSTNINLQLLSEGGYLYMVDGSTLVISSNPESSVPTFSGCTVHAGATPVDVEDITSDGSYVYAAVGINGITRGSVGSTSFSKISSYAAKVIGYANGRLIAAKDGEIVEVGAVVNGSAPTTTLLTHNNPSFVFNHVTGGPQGIYVSGHAGSRSEIYLIRVDDSDGSLKTPVIATPLPDGEQVTTLLYYAGAVIIGTDTGFRLCQVLESGELRYGPLVRIPGGVYALEPESRFCWFGWSDYPEEEPTGDILPHRSGMGRMNLGTFTQPLVPAYATDIMVGSVGTPLSGRTTSIVTFEGKRYFTIADAGLYAETDDYETSGYLWSGWIRYGITAPKVASRIDLRHEPLVGSVKAEMLTEDLIVTDFGTNSLVSSLEPEGGLQEQLQMGEAAQLKLTLNQGGVQQTPVLNRWTVRALPSPERIDEIILPLVLSESVSSMVDQTSIYYDTLEEFLYLQGLVGSGQIVRYREGATEYLVYVDRLEAQPKNWNADRSWFNGTVIVRLLVVGEA